MADWQTILTSHGRAVWSAGYRLLSHSGDADDCFQQAMLDAFRWTSRGRPVGDWQKFLIRLITLRAMDRLRERYRNGARAEANLLSDVADSSATPAELAERSEEADRVRRWIAALPPKQAEAFSLHAVEGWSYREIADAMNLRVDHVGVLISRARAGLQQRYAQRGNRRSADESELVR